MLTASILAGLFGVLVGYLAGSAGRREDRARGYSEGVDRGRELESLGIDTGPAEVVLLSDGREVHGWKTTVGQGDLHRQLQAAGTGL
jgi:hypothetical protein